MNNEDYDLIERDKHSLVAFILSIILLVGFPYFWYWFFGRLFGVFETNNVDELSYYTVVFIGFFIGFLFQMICVLKGIVKDSYSVYKERKRRLKENLKINFGFAMKIYFSDIKEHGIGFTVYMIVFLCTLYKALYALTLIILMVGIV